MLKKLELPLPVKTEVVCPNCGEIYQRLVEADYANSPNAWRIGGYLVILCRRCKKVIDKRVKEASDESISSAH